MSKRMLITGASKGIGAATARHFLESVHDVMELILVARDSEAFDRTLDELGAVKGAAKRIHPYRIDLADRGEVIRLMKDVSVNHGNIDILLNNAGFTLPCSMQQVAFADFERTMAVNLYAPFTIVQELLHHGNHFESIVNIASTAGINGRAGWLTYSASKAAMINMSEVMREELMIYGTRVACLAPGRCATDLRRTLAPDEDPTTIMQPEHVARIIELMTSEAGRFIDSQRVVVRM